ncbi:MAG: twin-arginine translocase subunit TatB [Alphaproteobacteria bacterium PRO2]|nr:twin-arginine translocase subunit TatB [Alphaproteobacteria bacterium PRO2]
MFDIGWSELLLVAVVAVLVIGPDELPAIMRMLGRVVRRLQYVRYAFSQQFEDFMKENDLADIRKQVNFEAKDFDESQSDEGEDLEPPRKASDGN